MLWPAAISTMTALVAALLCGLPGLVSFVLIPLSALGGLVSAVTLVIAAIVFAARRRPRKAGSVLVAALLPVILWQPITWTADYLHLALTVWTGAGQAGPPSKPDNSRFVAYDWSVGLAGGPNTFLIRDETDEITLPLKQHTRPIAEEDGFSEDCAGRVKHLLGHYYVCTF